MDASHDTSLFNHLSNLHSEFKDPATSAGLKWLYSTQDDEDEYTQQLHMNFWRTAILDCNLKGHLGSQHYCLAVDIEKVDAAFYRPDLGKASALDSVLTDLIQTNDLISLDSFANTYTTISWLGRVYNTVTRTPAQWPPLPYSTSTTSATSTGIVSSFPKLYVVMSSIRTIALSILHRYQQHGSHFSSVDSILTFTEFRSDYGVYQGNHLTDADLWLLLRYMTCQYGLGVDSNVRGYGRSHVAIKFPEHNENSITATTTTNNTNSIIMDPPPTNTISSTQINESDKAIISLKTTCKALHDQVNKLQLQLESAVKQSLSYSSKQQKPQALYAVKRKLQLEQILNRRLQSLETMETLLLKIDASHNDIQIIQAFNMGVASLKQIFNDNGLTVTSVDETMLNMQTTLEEHERVEEAMTNGQQYIFTAMGRSNKINEDDNDDVEENIQQVSDNNRLTLPRIASQEKRTRNDLEDDDDNAHLSEIPPPPPSATPNSELARLHAIFSALPQIPSDPPRSKQRRLRQLA